MESTSWPGSRPTARACEHVERTARLVNLVLPVGWLPLGVMAAAEGQYRAVDSGVCWE